MEKDAEFAKDWPTLGKAIESGIESHDGREAQLLAYILSHNPTHPLDVLSTIDEFSLREDFLISVGPNKADILRDLIMREKPRMLVELGGYLGYSAVLFADAMVKAHGGDEGLKIYSLELDPICAAIARQIAQIAGLDHIIEVVEGTAASSITNLVKENKITSVVFLFLDHVEDLYEQDFKVVEALSVLKKGAVVVADNVIRPGAPEYREFIRGDMKKEQGWESRGVKGLIWPGNFEDELEVSKLVGLEVNN
ncbi:catechol o-methyltransferase [Botrytis cinerea]